jgi:hypothetical protein
MGVDTKTYWLTDWLTDRQSQCDSDFDMNCQFSRRSVVVQLPANAEVKKMWIYTATPPYAFMA